MRSLYSVCGVFPGRARSNWVTYTSAYPAQIALLIGGATRPHKMIGQPCVRSVGNGSVGQGRESESVWAHSIVVGCGARAGAGRCCWLARWQARYLQQANRPYFVVPRPQL